jgi:hypothetical protein
MKGQFLTIEQMVLFTIGVAITITIFYTFSSIQTKIEKETVQDQLYSIGSFILSTMSKTTTNSSFVSIILDIPADVSGEEYKIIASNPTLFVGLVDKEGSAELSLAGINESFNIRGYVGSSAGKIIVERDGDRIWLKRPKR